jgi:hypothetical protein
MPCRSAYRAGMAVETLDRGWIALHQNTGRLTAAMFEAVFARAVALREGVAR